MKTIFTEWSSNAVKLKSLHITRHSCFALNLELVKSIKPRYKYYYHFCNTSQSMFEFFCQSLYKISVKLLAAIRLFLINWLSTFQPYILPNFYLLLGILAFSVVSFQKIFYIHFIYSYCTFCIFILYTYYTLNIYIHPA